MSDARPIGIFDSGIGGLTVVHEIFNRMPHENIVYFGDTARVPYGTKSPRVVEQFAREDVFFLLKKNVKLVVAACHTVSSVALDGLVSSLHLPILGVVDPGVKAALEVTRNNRVGVIGTKATIVSRSYEAKFRAKNPEIKLISKACPLFVPLAEEGWLDSKVTSLTAEIYLESLIEAKIDTLILGCTHYPLLKKIIRRIMGDTVTIIDSAEETAKQVERRLRLIRMNNTSGAETKHDFFVSDIPHQFQEIGERFLGDRLGKVTRVELDTLH